MFIKLDVGSVIVVVDWWWRWRVVVEELWWWEVVVVVRTCSVGFIGICAACALRGVAIGVRCVMMFAPPMNQTVSFSSSMY